jgi:lipopolysaccharide biosynthesis glycosyltransferase
VGDLRLGLVTVTTEAFVPGTLVLVHSFLRCNPWFRGDIIVIHDELSAASRRYLSLVADRVRWLPVGEPLRRQIDAVVAARPDLSAVRARFYSLETFRLRDYDRVLFCDSDIVARDSIQELLELPGGFVACGDGPHYSGRAIDGPAAEARFDPAATFNTGVFLVDRGCLTDDEYGGLLAATTPETFLGSTSGRTDSIVLNRAFGARARLAGAEFNYLLAFRAAIERQRRVGLSDARMVHFNTRDKPWVAAQALRGAVADAAYGKACAIWIRSYAACLSHLSLRSRFASRTG